MLAKNYSELLCNLTITTACAAIPSSRPVKPSFSVVVALILMRVLSSFNSSVICKIIASRCGVILGFSQIMVASIFTISPPLVLSNS